MRAEDVQEIVAAYGDALVEPTALGTIRDARSLPYSKEQIKGALVSALKVATAPLKEHLRIGSVTLADFQQLSDKEIHALQVWNAEINRRATDARDIDKAHFAKVSALNDIVIAVQTRVANEAHSLLLELKAAGF